MCHTSISYQVYCNRGNVLMNLAFRKSFPSATILFQFCFGFTSGQPKSCSEKKIFFKFLTFWVSQNFVNVFQKLFRLFVCLFVFLLICITKTTSGSSPIHVRFVAEMRQSLGAQDTLRAIKAPTQTFNNFFSMIF